MGFVFYYDFLKFQPPWDSIGVVVILGWVEFENLTKLRGTLTGWSTSPYE